MDHQAIEPDAMRLARAVEQVGGDRWFDFVSEMAADRAAFVYLTTATEAERCAADEDPAQLKDRLLVIVAENGCEFASEIGGSLEDVRDDPALRNPIEIFAAREYQTAFGRLLLVGSAGGHA